MKRTSILGIALMSILASQAMAQTTLAYNDGYVSIQFDRASLARKNITLSDIKGQDSGVALRMQANVWSMNRSRSNLQLELDKHDNLSIGIGELTVNGGFTLTRGLGQVSFQDFGLQQGKERGMADLNLVGYHYPPYGPVAIEANTPLVQIDKRSGLVQLTSYELKVSAELASYWGDPALRGTRIGVLNVVGNAVPIRFSAPQLPTPRVGPELDIAMCQLYGFSVISGGSATINGVAYNTYSAGTDSVNFGANPVTWLSTSQASNVNHMHPTIGLNVFRKLSTGELEQIGEGQVKHAFTALQQPTCGSCTATGSSALGMGCSDPYVASLNSSQSSLGPKIEVNPYTGIWNKTGSWYSTRPSGYVYSPTELRMKVANQDVLPSGQATYYMEGYYMAGFANNGTTATSNPAQITATVDTNKINNFGWRQVSLSVNTSGAASASDSGSFAADSSETTNPNRRPLIMTWGDGRQVMEPRLVGDVITAYRVTPVSGDPGWYKYDYSVYNMDLDRQVKTFHISVADSVNVRNITFRDIDKDNTNEWTMTRANGDISWEMQSGATNPLVFGRLYNFRFEAQVAPVAGWSSATMVKSGDFPELNRQVSGPPASTQPLTGTITVPGWTGPVEPKINIRLTPVDSGSVVNINNVPVSGVGAFIAQAGVRGRYLISISGAPFLRKNLAPIFTIGHDGNDIPINATLVTGNVDGGLEIDPVDIDMVIAEFGSQDPTPADVNGNGEVDPVDIDTVISNFGAQGDL